MTLKVKHFLNLLNRVKKVIPKYSTEIDADMKNIFDDRRQLFIICKRDQSRQHSNAIAVDQFLPIHYCIIKTH